MASLLFCDFRVFILSTLDNTSTFTCVDGDNVVVYAEIFLTIVNGFQPLFIKIKRSILDFASVLDPPLNTIERL